MSTSLLQFYNDKDTKENVYNYLIQELEKEAIRKAFAKEDTSGVAEAKELIDKAFENLEVVRRLRLRLFR